MKDLMKKLSEIDLPEIETVRHKELLKASLINSMRHKSSYGGLFIFFYDFINNFINMSKKTVAVSASIVLVVGLLVTLSQWNGDSTLVAPHAEAQELLAKVVNESKKLSDEQRLEVEKKINDDLEGTLEEAEKAPDLKILSENSNELTYTFNDDAPAVIKIVSDVPVKKFLSYTNAKKKKIILGVDENNVVVMKGVKD